MRQVLAASAEAPNRPVDRKRLPATRMTRSPTGQGLQRRQGQSKTGDMYVFQWVALREAEAAPERAATLASIFRIALVHVAA